MVDDNNKAAPTGQETPPAGPATQHAGAEPPEGGAPDPAKTVSRDEFNRVVAQRQAEKEARRSLEEQVSLLTKTVSQMPDAETLEQFQGWRQEQEQEARKKALKDGDADAIASSARKPLETENQTLRGQVDSLTGQLTTLLRDHALRDAIDQSPLQAIDPVVVRDALTPRVKMVTENGTCKPVFVGADGQTLYNAQGKITEIQEFVDAYLKEHPGLCRTKAQPGSGAKPPGGAAPEKAGTPHSLAEYMALEPEQRGRLAETMSSDDRKRLLGQQVDVPAGSLLTP